MHEHVLVGNFVGRMNYEGKVVVAPSTPKVEKKRSKDSGRSTFCWDLELNR